mgnify:CR=1 FL=1
MKNFTLILPVFNDWESLNVFSDLRAFRTADDIGSTVSMSIDEYLKLDDTGDIIDSNIKESFSGNICFYHSSFIPLLEHENYHDFPNFLENPAVEEGVVCGKKLSETDSGETCLLSRELIPACPEKQTDPDDPDNENVPTPGVTQEQDDRQTFPFILESLDQLLWEEGSIIYVDSPPAMKADSKLLPDIQIASGCYKIGPVQTANKADFEKFFDENGDYPSSWDMDMSRVSDCHEEGSHCLTPTPTPSPTPTPTPTPSPTACYEEPQEVSDVTFYQTTFDLCFKAAYGSEEANWFEADAGFAAEMVNQVFGYDWTKVLSGAKPATYDVNFGTSGDVHIHTSSEENYNAASTLSAKSSN